MRWMIILFLFGLLGCTDAPLQTPPGFVEIGSDGVFAYKAVAPDGATIGVRQRRNTEKGDLAFWTEVFRLEMVEGKGYVLRQTQEVSSADGVVGVQFEFDVPNERTPFYYSLSLFITEEHLVTLEMGAELSKTEGYKKSFAQALATLRPKVFD